MAREASLEVEVVLTVRALVAAECASHEELRRFVEREQDAVRATVAARVQRVSGSREAGWLDDDRVVLVTEITEAEPARVERDGLTDGLTVVR